MSRYDYDEWPAYVPVATRRLQAAKKVAKMKKAGKSIHPIDIVGRKIATTFWGEAWCRNLESYSDFSNRLPRGRTYVRNGSVIDLQIEPGRVRALVSGSKVYKVDIKIKSLAKKRWTGVKKACAGQIGSLIELLQGSISKSVMEIVSRKDLGLFPSPREISLDCSCPDWATMCKHVAATLYGVGARLDDEPELLFDLRGVDPAELVKEAINQAPPAGPSRRSRTLKTDELSSVFGIDIDLENDDENSEGAPPAPKRSKKRASPTRTTKKATSKVKTKRGTSRKTEGRSTAKTTRARKSTK
jgi:uncharacterized Zn finger protein